MRKKLLTAIAGGIVFLSGCSGEYSFSGLLGTEKKDTSCEIDLSNTRYKSALEKRAELLSKDKTYSSKKEAIILYGELGELEKMDAIINETIKSSGEKTSSVLEYVRLGEGYYKKKEGKSKDN